MLDPASSLVVSLDKYQSIEHNIELSGPPDAPLVSGGTMAISELAIIGAGRIGRAALSSYGWQLGKGAYRNTGDIVMVGIAAVVGGAGFILPFIAGRRVFQWHPQGPVWFFFRVLVNWLFLASLGSAILFVMMYLLGDILYPSRGNSWTAARAYPFAIQWTQVIAIGFFGLGALKGLTERSRRKNGVQVVYDNQAFLDANGFQELDGKNTTHVDGKGNRLRLDHVGSDIIEFEAAGANGKRAYILIGPDGRYLTYSGLVSD